jgi:hypothetical protein
MACYRPLKGWKSRSPSASGKRGIVFGLSEGMADFPMEVACGQCLGCRLDRVRQWATRIVHEGSLHDRQCFLTLTYDAAHLPEGQRLVKSHLQLFMKRLRSFLGGKRVRFFACGEYGGDLGRPHYHMILFGEDFSADRKKHSGNGGNTLYSSETLSRLWGMGFCSIGSVTPGSARYVASYVIDKFTGDGAPEHYRYLEPLTGEIFDRPSPFVVMSRRPGIGADWFDRFGDDVYPSDFAILGGQRVSVPKFYDRLLERSDEELLSDLKRQRKVRAMARCVDNTPDRLAVREVVASERRRFFSGRSL